MPICPCALGGHEQFRVIGRDEAHHNNVPAPVPHDQCQQDQAQGLPGLNTPAAKMRQPLMPLGYLTCALLFVLPILTTFSEHGSAWCFWTTTLRRAGSPSATSTLPCSPPVSRRASATSYRFDRPLPPPPVSFPPQPALKWPKMHQEVVWPFIPSSKLMTPWHQLQSYFPPKAVWNSTESLCSIIFPRSFASTPFL